MYVFLSYAREDRTQAETIRSALAAAGFDCFFDQKSLPFGQEYNARIGQAIQRADLFIFLVSDAALEPGSYALTELSFAEKKWRNPAGHVLPVVPVGFDAGALPAYLRPINVLQARGNVEAEVVGWIRERIELGGGGGVEETPEMRLERWLRLHQPPLRRVRKLPWRFVITVPLGLGFVAIGLFLGSTFGQDHAPTGFGGVETAFVTIFVLGAAGLTLHALVQTIRALAGAGPVGAIVLDRSESRDGVTVHLLLPSGVQQRCAAVGRAASRVYPGDIGWAFATGGLLLDFERGSRARRDGDPGSSPGE